MDQNKKSGYFYANSIVGAALKAYEDVTGKNGLSAILNLAHLSHLIHNYPPDNLDRIFDFADFTAIQIGLEDMYGARVGHGLMLRTGRAVFAASFRNFGALAGVSNPAFAKLPLSTKLRIGIPAISKIFNQISDQSTTVQEREIDFLYTLHHCPECWERSGLDKPVCYFGAGLLLEGLRWVSGGNEFHIHENRCMAIGDSVCEYTILKNPNRHEV